MSLSHALPIPADIPGTLIEEAIDYQQNPKRTTEPNSALEAYQRGLLTTYDPARKLTTDVSYLFRLLSSPNDFRETLEAAVAALHPIVGQFSAIAFTGNSGAMFAPALALRLNKQLILVRKSTEGSHSTQIIEGVAEKCDYIFVDDTIDTGTTFARVVEQIESNWKTRGSKLRAVYCYNTGWLIVEPGRHVANGVSIADEKTTREENIKL